MHSTTLHRSGSADSSSALFGADPAEALLSELFVDRFGNSAWDELQAFLRIVSRTNLPFDLSEQLRRHEYPGYPGYEQGLPTVYYYFVPESGWGSEHAFPTKPLDPGFVRSMDGFGLNFGCPLRLKRALELLESLPISEQKSCREGLASPTKHFPMVEELLWLEVWKDGTDKHHLQETTTKTHDWNIIFPDKLLRVECKFRPSDWPRLIDGSAHFPLAGSLTRKASEQLGRAALNELNVLAVTGVAPITNAFQEFCSAELQQAKNIAALVYRSFAGETALISKDHDVAAEISDKIPPQEAQPFQPFYFLCTHRAEAQRRQQHRAKATRESLLGANVTRIDIESLPPRKILFEPPLPYRMNLVKRLPTGEPVFEHVPPYLPLDKSDDT